MPWTNQDIYLYHGTLDLHVASILSGIHPAHASARADFGQGFYTTTNEAQARLWARVLVHRYQRYPARPAVIRFQVSRDALAGLHTLWFVRGTRTAQDLWDFVVYCRTGGVAHGRAGLQGWYDVVVGPVAGTRWRRRRIIPNFDQVSFHGKGLLLLTTCSKKVFDFHSGKWKAREEVQ